jgi:hypothetical protein
MFIAVFVARKQFNKREAPNIDPFLISSPKVSRAQSGTFLRQRDGLL